MWQVIYGSHPKLSKGSVREYASRINELNLGPTKPLALHSLYLAAGNDAAAVRTLSQARYRYTVSLVSLFALMVLAIIAGFIGVWVIGYFLGHRRSIFQEAEKKAALCKDIQYPVLWSSFLGYMIAFVVLGILVSFVVAPVIDKLPASESLLYALGAQLAVSVLSGLIGLGILVYLTKQLGGDLCDIGITTRDFWKNVGWGFLGYAGLLPIILLMAVVSSLVFGKSSSAEHPIIPMLLSGGWLSKFAILVLASVLAPIFEEVFFRGVLYNALRARLSIAIATLVSAFAFAIVHPQLPAGFLPIFGIGVVFAILFETRRSLVPSMVAHSLNNTLMLLFTILAFGD
jgi:membrane protease YdiL (CAAX protease family)